MAWGVRLRAIEQMKLLGQCRVDGLELHAIEQMQWNAVASTAWKRHAIEQTQSRERGAPSNFDTDKNVLHPQVRQHRQPGLRELVAVHEPPSGRSRSSPQ